MKQLIQIKRACDPEEKTDGFRVYIDLLYRVDFHMRHSITTCGIKI